MFDPSADSVGGVAKRNEKAGDAVTTWPQPARIVSLLRAFRRRCPVCGQKGISRHAVHIDTTCPTCALNLERQVGSFIGGIGLNTIVTFVAIIVVLVAGFVWTRGEASVTRILIPLLAVSVALPLWFYARSRLLWVALELIWWPLADDELVRSGGGEEEPPQLA